MTVAPTSLNGHSPDSGKRNGPPADALRALIEQMSNADVEVLSKALATQRRPVEPWRRRELIVVGTGLFLALLLVLVAWVGASETGVASLLILWLAFGIVGLLVGALPATWWVLEGTRNVHSQIARVGDDLREYLVQEQVAGVPGMETIASDTSHDVPRAVGLVSSPAMSLYHLPDCPAALGKSLESSPLAAHLRLKRRPCGICQP